MILYPAIDLRGGNCVRLYQGDYDQETVYGADPVAQALAFVHEGAPWLHVVDLDAAKSGDPIIRPRSSRTQVTPHPADARARSTPSASGPPPLRSSTSITSAGPIPRLRPVLPRRPR